MRRTEISNYGEAWRDIVEFLDGFVKNENPELYKEIEWILEAEPWVLVLYNSRIPITKWVPMREQELMEAAGMTLTELRKFKEDASADIKDNWGVEFSGS